MQAQCQTTWSDHETKVWFLQDEERTSTRMRKSSFRRKNRQDPNPDRRGKAKNVATEEVVLEGEKDTVTIR